MNEVPVLTFCQRRAPYLTNVITLFCALLFMCGASSRAQSGLAATPTFNNVLSGTSQIIMISDTSPGATIYYTTDGTTPTIASNVYRGSLTISSSVTINAIASGGGWSTSAVATEIAGGYETVNFGALKEVIRGFGASTAFLGREPASTMSTLFGTGSGQIGLNILRLSIDPTGVPSSNYVTTRWTDEMTNARNALAANPATIIYATPWSPPGSMKTNAVTPYQTTCYLPPDVASDPLVQQNGTAAHLCGGGLDPAHYDDYAVYLNDYITYMKNNGVLLYGISMQNEPDGDPTYEGCVWSPTNLDAWVAGSASVLTTRLIMPEASGFSFSYSDPTLNDSSAVSHVSIVGGHMYMNGTGVATPTYYANAVSKGKDVWSTEHYVTPISGSTTAQPVLADALVAAHDIHNAFAMGDLNAYVWWWASEFRPNKGTVDNNYGLVDQNDEPTYYGYAMSHFSKFILPGYYRATAAPTPASGLYMTPWTGNGHYVMVVINTNTFPVVQTLALQNGTFTSLTPYQTTAAGNLQQLSAIPISGGTFFYTYPAQSITTLVQ